MVGCAPSSHAPRRPRNAFQQSLIGSHAAIARQTPHRSRAPRRNNVLDRSAGRTSLPSTSAAPSLAPWRERVVARATASVGRRLVGEPTAATRNWLAELLDRPTARLPPWSALQLRRDACQPGDLVLFAVRDAPGRDRSRDPAPRDPRGGERLPLTTADLVAGVVCACQGSRADFVFVSGPYVRHGRLDQADPHQRRNPRGGVINSFVRVRLPGDAPGAEYLAGALFAGYATVAAP